MQPCLIHNSEIQLERKGCNPPTSFIDTLSDDELLEIFHCCRLDIPLGWNHKWWYKLIHTCRRWRHIVLESSTSLQLHLYCTYGKPIEEMLKFLPPLPLEIDFVGEQAMSTKDEEGTLLALQQHHRVRLIGLSEPALQKLVALMDKPFPMLEDLILTSPDLYYRSRLPETFSAPRLRHLDLIKVGDVLAPGIPLLSSITGLISLSLEGVPSPTSLPVTYLVSRLSLMPQLENLSLEFDDSELQYLSSLKNHKSDPANPQIVLLPRLEEIALRGSCVYLEDLLSCIRTPILTYFTVMFFPRPRKPLPRLSEFLAATEGLRYPVASLTFCGTREEDPTVSITVAGSERTAHWRPQEAPFHIRFRCMDIDEQVVCAAQICTAMSPMLSDVERLHLNYHATRRRGPPTDIPRAVWWALLRPFPNVLKLQLDTVMTRMLSHALCQEEGTPAQEILPILPKLYKLSRPHHARFKGMLDPFIAARRATGQPFTKRRRPPNSDPESEESWHVSDSDEEISTEVDSDSDFHSE